MRLPQTLSRNPFVRNAQQQPRRPDPMLALATLQAQGDQQARQDSSRRGDQRFRLLLETLRGGREASNEAKQANLDRYHDVLALFGNTRSDVLGDLEGFGKSQETDINRRWDESRNNLITDLAQRGLSGSTGRIPIETRTNEGRGRELERLEDLLRQIRSGAKERFADKAAGVMERRTDSYPDTSNLSALAGMIGQLDEPAPSGPNPIEQLLMQQAISQQPSAPRQSPFQQRSLSGTPRMVAPQPLSGPGQQAPYQLRHRSPQASGEAEMNRRRLLVALKNARESRGAVPGGSMGRERAAQDAAILAGVGGYAPAQQAPIVENAHPSILDGAGDATPYLAQLLQQLLQGGGYQQPRQQQQQQQQGPTPYDREQARRQKRQATIAKLQALARSRRDNMPQPLPVSVWAGL